MSDKRILIQLDPDPHCSVFDAVVAVDSDVEHLLQYSAVEPVQVRDLVHGAMFTRGVDKLKNTAIFVGGKDVVRGEALLAQVTSTFFGPMRVSVMMDANGANTTAAAAVVSAERHMQLAGAKAVVLAATGSVGQRVVRMLATAGASVRAASRRMDRAETVCDSIKSAVDASLDITAVETSNDDNTREALDGAEIIVSCGAAGIQILSEDEWKALPSLKVAIDLNAVPPLGIEGITVADKATQHDGRFVYGAIGVGGTKMKIHKEAVRRLFASNDLVLDADELFAIGRELTS